MTAATCLADLLEVSAREVPERPAVCVAGAPGLSYGELDALANRFRDRLWERGVRPGDRVGLMLRKSVDAVAAIFGVLKAGAAYVPVDAESPVGRAAFILRDCAVTVVLTEHRLVAHLSEELRQTGPVPELWGIDLGTSAVPLAAWLDSMERTQPAPQVPTVRATPDDIAYILYTSGSTGNPKGVVLSHRNALSFVDWCSDVFQPFMNDTFSSHAPFHFDLSILDLFVPIKHGAGLVLFGEVLGKDPVRLAEAIDAERISVWYSTPSILSLLANYGKLDRFAFSSLRIVLFAGEVFPVPQFSLLRGFWRRPRFFNLYGPTETNVCTYYEVPGDESWKELDTFPIGSICDPNLGKVVDDSGDEVGLGEPGELVVSGPNVMTGYWNLPEHNRQAFLVDPDERRWYKTGDIVKEGPTGQYTYLSRRDRMVKRRGYRVELGEIEVALLRHPDIREAAVVALPDSESGVRIAAFVVGLASNALTVIALKGHSARELPPYMIPDTFTLVEALPRTSTNKIDYQTLKSTLPG